MRMWHIATHNVLTSHDHILIWVIIVKLTHSPWLDEWLRHIMICDAIINKHISICHVFSILVFRVLRHFLSRLWFVFNIYATVLFTICQVFMPQPNFKTTTYLTMVPIIQRSFIEIIYLNYLIFNSEKLPKVYFDKSFIFDIFKLTLTLPHLAP